MKKMSFKIGLDIILTAVFLLLMSLDTTGVLWHEILGLYVGGMVILHLVLNRDWIKAVTVKFRSTQPRLRRIYILNLLIGLTTLLTIVGGILISQELFRDWFSVDLVFWSALHHLTAYTGLALVSVHLGLHWKMILAFFRKLLKIQGESRFRKAVLRGVAGLLAVVGLRSAFQPELWESVLPLSATGVTITSLTGKSYLALPAVQITAVTTQVSTPTLEEYLSKLICTACHRHCPLSAPRCSKGIRQAAQAESAYYETYADNTQTSSAAIYEVSSSVSDSVDIPESSTAADDATVVESSESVSLAVSDVTSSTPGSTSENESISQSASQESASTPSQAELLTESTQSEEEEPQNKLFDAFSLMGLVVGGTYYTRELTGKMRNRPQKE